MNTQEDNLKKEIEKQLIKIKPTKEEVDKMSEYNWTTRVYPIRAYIKGYKKGQEAERKRIDKIWNCWINENSNFYSENYKILNKLLKQIKEKRK